MKKNSLRSLALTLGVLAAVGLSSGPLGGVLIATATGNNTSSSSGNGSSGGGSSAPAAPAVPVDFTVEVDWNNVSASVDAALQDTQSRNVTIVAGSQYTVPVSILDTVARNNKVLMMDAGHGMTVSVSGEDVTGDAALSIDLSRNLSVSEDVYRSVANASYVYRTFALKEDSVIPFKIGMHINLGAEYASKVAVLYRYDAATSSMTAEASFTVAENGNALFALSRSGEYVVSVVDAAPQLTGDYVVSSGDTLSKIANKFGISLSSLIQANPQLTNPDRISVGQTLNIR